MVASSDLRNIEKDILREFINIGVAKTADFLAAMLKGKVMLNVPEINASNNGALLKEITGSSSWLAIVSEFNGEISGKILFYQSGEIIRKLEKASTGFINNSLEFANINQPAFANICFMLTKILMKEINGLLEFKNDGISIKQYIYSESKGIKEIGQALDLPNNFLFTIRTKIINGSLNFNLPVILLFDFFNINKIISKIRSIERNIL